MMHSFKLTISRVLLVTSALAVFGAKGLMAVGTDDDQAEPATSSVRIRAAIAVPQQLTPEIVRDIIKQWISSYKKGRL